MLHNYKINKLVESNQTHKIITSLFYATDFNRTQYSLKMNDRCVYNLLHDKVLARSEEV